MKCSQSNSPESCESELLRQWRPRAMISNCDPKKPKSTLQFSYDFKARHKLSNVSYAARNSLCCFCLLQLRSSTKRFHKSHFSKLVLGQKKISDISNNKACIARYLCFWQDSVLTSRREGMHRCKMFTCCWKQQSPKTNALSAFPLFAIIVALCQVLTGADGN